MFKDIIWRDVFRPARTVWYAILTVSSILFSLDFAFSDNPLMVIFPISSFVIAVYLFLFNPRNHAKQERQWEEEIEWCRDNARRVREEQEYEEYLKQEALAESIAEKLQNKGALAGTSCNYRKEDVH